MRTAFAGFVGLVATATITQERDPFTPPADAPGEQVIEVRAPQAELRAELKAIGGVKLQGRAAMRPIKRGLELVVAIAGSDPGLYAIAIHDAGACARFGLDERRRADFILAQAEEPAEETESSTAGAPPPGSMAAHERALQERAEALRRAREAREAERLRNEPPPRPNVPTKRDPGIPNPSGKGADVASGELIILGYVLVGHDGYAYLETRLTLRDAGVTDFGELTKKSLVVQRVPVREGDPAAYDAVACGSITPPPDVGTM